MEEDDYMKSKIRKHTVLLTVMALCMVFAMMPAQTFAKSKEIQVVNHLGRTGTVSYKNLKQIAKSAEEWIKVENTHEPLISQETWDFVQSLDKHPSRNRCGKSGFVHLYASVLHCIDCGAGEYSADAGDLLLW